MKKLLLVLSLAFILFVFGANGAFAAGLCCQLSSGVQENIMGVAGPGTHNLSVFLDYNFNMMDKLREGTHEKSVQDIENEGKYTSIPEKMEMTRYSLTLAYGFTPRFKMLVNVPYVHNTMDMQMKKGMMWMPHTMEPVSGLGDITVMGLYRLLTDRDIRPTAALTAGVGVKTPTGSYTEKNSKGNFIHAHMQPGTGSWDPILTLIYSKLMNPWLFQADVTYEIATRNNEGYEFGNTFTANVLAKYGLVPIMNLTGELTYLHTGRASDRDGKYTNLMSLEDDPANTGEDSLWFSPGFELVPLKNGSLNVKAQLPLWQRVNGVQLVTSYRIITGVNYSF